MTYPKVSHTDADARRRPVDARPSRQIEEAVLAYWEDDDTFRASVEQRDAGRRTAPTSSSSTTARRSPTACRTTATC